MWPLIWKKKWPFTWHWATYVKEMASCINMPTYMKIWPHIWNMTSCMKEMASRINMATYIKYASYVKYDLLYERNGLLIERNGLCHAKGPLIWRKKPLQWKKWPFISIILNQVNLYLWQLVSTAKYYNKSEAMWCKLYICTRQCIICVNMK